MSEEETQTKSEKEKEVTSETATASTEETGTEKATSTLDRADQIAQMQKRENDRRESLLKREEDLAARKAVGGETEAGKSAEKKEETPKEYRARVEKEMAGGKTEFGN